MQEYLTTLSLPQNFKKIITKSDKQISEGNFKDGINPQIMDLIVELCVFGLAIIMLFFAHYLKKRLETIRQRNLCDFSQYQDYRRLQSAESNQSSENFSPRKSDNKRSEKQEIQEGLLETGVGTKKYFRAQNLFSKFSETSV